MICAAQVWRNEVQALLQINFLVSLSVLSIVFCMCIYTLSSIDQFHWVVYGFPDLDCFRVGAFHLLLDRQ